MPFPPPIAVNDESSYSQPGLKRGGANSSFRDDDSNDNNNNNSTNHHHTLIMRRFNSSHHSHLTTSSKYLHHNGQQQELNEHHHRNSTPYWWPLDALLKKMYYSKFTDQSPMNIPQNYDGGNRGDGEDYDDIERGREGMNYELFRDSVPVSLNDGNNHLHHGNDDVDERPSSQNYNDQNSSHRYFTEQPKAKYAALRTHKRFTINPLKACLGSTLTVILLGVMALIILLVVLLLVSIGCDDMSIHHHLLNLMTLLDD